MRGCGPSNPTNPDLSRTTSATSTSLLPTAAGSTFPPEGEAAAQPAPRVPRVRQERVVRQDRPDRPDRRAPQALREPRVRLGLRVPRAVRETSDPQGPLGELDPQD